MKSFRRIFVFVIIGFSVLLTAFNVIYGKVIRNRHTARYVVMNRISNTIKQELEMNVSTNIPDIWKENREQWRMEYGEENVPDSLLFIPLSTVEPEKLSVVETSWQSYIWNVYGKDGSLKGLVEYRYEDNFIAGNRLIINVVLVTCFFCIVAILLHINRKILKPFHNFSEYPEKLSKGITNEKLPEIKNRYFGKFVWGMNMLNDHLVSNEKKIQELEYDRQTMLTAIAHGVKTPVANIKLYANAIETGLYTESKKVDRKDAEIAAKIEKNAMDIEKLVSDMLVTASTALCDYEPQIQLFYMKELAEQIEQEYANRLNVNRIAYTIDCLGNPLINSDKNGLFHILSQFIENAIKYGDGTGITISMEKQDDGYYLSVKNKGELLPEQEMPFIFKSFWRGSNAEHADGCGIGLFVSKEMAKRLGGDIYVKRWEDTSEMEFAIFIEE